MRKSARLASMSVATAASATLLLGIVYAQEKPDSYMPVVIKETLAAVMNRMKAEKPAIEARHQALLEQRYDLANRPGSATMSRGKPVQTGPRARLSAGVTWDSLASLTPEQIKQQGVFPQGFLPLPHPNHKEGGML